MKKQYVVRKYVMANSVADAIRISHKTPIHEVHIDNAWWEKSVAYNFYPSEVVKSGFNEKKHE